LWGVLNFTPLNTVEALKSFIKIIFSIDALGHLFLLKVYVYKHKSTLSCLVNVEILGEFNLALTLNKENMLKRINDDFRQGECD